MSITSTEFECELQEVWSVRKNVHHTALTRTNNEIITANHNEPTRVYSRHKQGGQINSRSLPGEHKQPAGKMKYLYVGKEVKNRRTLAGRNEREGRRRDDEV